jgi:hypothetical protein
VSDVGFPPDPTAGGRARRPAMRARVRIAAGAITVCACLVAAAAAFAGDSLTVNASFSPDRLSAPTNLSLTASFSSSAGRPPSPITRFTLYAPAGMGVDTRGAGTCAATALEQRGPRGCPADSRAGFGGGVGALELPNETLHVPYTLDIFFASRQSGLLRLLVYASASAPAGVQLVLVAKQIPAPKPYGLGFSVEVPPISTFPGASEASIESVFVTVGSPDVAYYEPVHGKERLVHLRGIEAPKSCPSGGFPAEGIVDFADGTTLTANPTIPCPHG